MITREEALQTIHDCRITSLGKLAYGYTVYQATANTLINQLFDQFESQLSSNPLQLMCEWNMDEPDWNTYKTGCDKYFNLVEGNLKDNYFSNCPYCGGKITLKDTK